jgi:hypothetical protein
MTAHEGVLMADDPHYFAAFICLHGDVDNLGLNEHKCFVLSDTLGRDWICWRTDRESMMADCAAMFQDATEMQEKLLKNGYAGTGGTRAKLFVTRLPEPITWEEQIAELRESLGDDTDDDEGEEWKKR